MTGKILLLANQYWGNLIAEKLIEMGKEIVIFTNEEKDEKYWYRSMWDLSNKVPVFCYKKINGEFIAHINKIKPDIIISAGFRKIVPNIITSNYESVNIHGALLPKFRGACPINWAIICGERKIGVTLHKMIDKPDAGDILLQKEIMISETDTAKDAYDKALPLYPQMIEEYLKNKHKIVPVKQDENEMTYFHKRGPEDSRINWNDSAGGVYNLIRASSDPYPNAFAFSENKKIFITKAEKIKEKYRGLPGTIIFKEKEGVIVICGSLKDQNRALLIKEIRIDNEKIAAADFLKVGSKLT